MKKLVSVAAAVALLTIAGSAFAEDSIDTNSEKTFEEVTDKTASMDETVVETAMDETIVEAAKVKTDEKSKADKKSEEKASESSDSGKTIASAKADPADKTADPADKTEDGKAKASGKSDIPDAVKILTGQTTTQARFGGSFVFSQGLGLGTFVSNSYARQPYYGWAISMAPRVYLYKNLWLTMSFAMSGELSQSCPSGNTYPRVFMPSDLYLTLKYKYSIPKIKVNLTPYFRVGAPTSAQSRARDLYLSTGLGFSLSRMFGKHVLLSYAFSYNKNWNGSTNALLPASSSLIRLNGAEDAGSGQAYADGSLTTEMSIRNRLLASFIITDKWSISLLLAISNSWSYKGSLPTSADEFTAENAKPGRAQSDSTSGVIDVSYQAWDHVGFSVGLASSQPAFTNDNKSLRFPFFDFVSEGSNFTQFYFDINVNY